MTTVRRAVGTSIIAFAGLIASVAAPLQPAAAWPFNFPTKSESTPEPSPSPSPTPTPSPTPLRHLITPAPLRTRLLVTPAPLYTGLLITPAPLRTRLLITPVPLRSSSGLEQPASMEKSPTAPSVPAPRLESPTRPPAGQSGEAAPGFVLISSLWADPHIVHEREAPVPELREAAWMNGTWNAHLHVAGSPRRGDLDSSFVVAPTMRDHWLFGAEGKSRNFFFLGYDPLAGQWVMLQLDRSPGYALLTAPSGWENGRLALFGTSAYSDGQAYRKRTTIVRHGDGGFTITDDQLGPEGNYLPIDRYDFTRVK